MNECNHGQLARSCRECELEAEIEALRAQVAALKGCVPELPEPLYAGNHLPRFGIRWNGPTEPLCVPMDDGYWTPWHYAKAKHADCQAVIRHKGHDADCPARACSFVGFTSRCSQSPAWHKVVKVGHEYQSPPCSDACGHDRTTGEKA